MKKNIKLKKLFPKNNFKQDFIIKNIQPLSLAKKNEITFFDSISYKDEASKTKASACITTEKLKKFLPQSLNIFNYKKCIIRIGKSCKDNLPFLRY